MNKRSVKNSGRRTKRHREGGGGKLSCKKWGWERAIKLKYAESCLIPQEITDIKKMYIGHYKSEYMLTIKNRKIMYKVQTTKR